MNRRTRITASAIAVLSATLLVPAPAPAQGAAAQGAAAQGAPAQRAAAQGTAPRPTTAAERMAAWEARRALEAASPFADSAWRAVGPMQAGVRVEAIAVPPGRPSTLYVGVGSGNLWKSTDNGITWTPIFDHESTFTIGDVAVAPSDPDVVWVGTGETQPRHSGFSFAGTGVFRSQDGGATWEHRGLTDTHHIGGVVVHPDDPDRVWVAAIGHFWSTNEERGVFRTVDGGATWEKVLYLSDHTGAVELVMDPSDPDVLYAAMWDAVSGRPVEGGEESGVYRTVDGGETWERLEDGLPGGAMGRIGLGIAPSQPATVYAFVDNHAPSTVEDREIVGGELYRSDDRGDRWRKVNEDDLYDVFGVFGWKFTDVRVSPADPDRVFVMGNRGFVSDDGGRTFRRIGETILRLHDTEGVIMHLDQHEIWIDPTDPDRILLGNDGGLFQSWDGGDSWLHHNNIPAAEFYAIATDRAVPYRIYGGTQDNAALYGPGNIPLAEQHNDPWENVYLDRWTGGDSFDTYLDPTDPRYVYYEHQHGALRRMDITDDSVLTRYAESIRPSLPDSVDGEWRSGWYTPFIISRFDPHTLYLGGNRLLKSTDRGDSWTPISPDLSDPAGGQRAPVPFGTITMVTQSPFDPGLLYVGTEGGSLWRTRDEGGTWDRVGGALPDRWVSRVVASEHREGRVYASLSGFRYDDFRAWLYRSDDYGATWRSIVGNLPDETINVVVEDPLDARILYVGTDMGVWVTGDGGARWHALAPGLPTTPVHDLEVQPDAHELVIGTHGRSIFVLPLTEVRETLGAGHAEDR